MPSSLIIVALVVAWLLVLVPMIARRRQEVARTADSTLAARVVRSGGVLSTAEREPTMADASGEADTERFNDYDSDYEDTAGYEADYDYELDGDSDEDDYYERRPYRPGRGGFDAEAAALTARARYTFRQRVVVLMLLTAVATVLLAVTLSPLLWWLHVAVDLGLVGYLGYLRRQVRIEEEVRERRAARLAAQPRRAPAPEPEPEVEPDVAADDDEYEEPTSVLPQRQPLTRHVHPGTVVVDTDDEDPMFAELDDPGALPYRRAVGE